MESVFWDLGVVTVVHMMGGVSRKVVPGNYPLFLNFIKSLCFSLVGNHWGRENHSCKKNYPNSGSRILNSGEFRFFRPTELFMHRTKWTTNLIFRQKISLHLKQWLTNRINSMCTKTKEIFINSMTDLSFLLTRGFFGFSVSHFVPREVTLHCFLHFTSI